MTNDDNLHDAGIDSKRQIVIRLVDVNSWLHTTVAVCFERQLSEQLHYKRIGQIQGNNDIVVIQVMHTPIDLIYVGNKFANIGHNSIPAYNLFTSDLVDVVIYTVCPNSTDSKLCCGLPLSSI